VNTDPVSVRLVPAAAWSAVDPAPWGLAASRDAWTSRAVTAWKSWMSWKPTPTCRP